MLQEQPLMKTLGSVVSSAEKYGDSYEAITAYLRGQAQRQADELARLENNIAKTKQLLTQQKANWNSRRKAYRDCAGKYAGQLASKVTAHIHDLAMPEGRFEIEITAKDNLTKTGKDELTFLFTTNLGEPIRPLLGKSLPAVSCHAWRWLLKLYF